MWRLTGVILMLVSMFGVSLRPTLALAKGPILIVAIQTGSSASAGQEYIALANISNQAVSLEGARLEYIAAQSATASRTILLHGAVAAGELFELASTGYMVGQVDQAFASTLAAAGGHLRLVGPSGEWDLVGWGSATGARGQPALAPAAGERLERQKGQTYQNTGDNSQDFIIGGQTLGLVGNTTGLHLSELLPDPAPPALDATDEFIELQNVGPQPVQLGGLKLVVGTSSTKSFVLTVGQLDPGAYVVYRSGQTKLALGNGGSRVQLQGISGQVLDEVTYSKAFSGSAWAQEGGAWRWTVVPTPGEANQFQDVPLPLPKAASKTMPKKSTKKTAKKTAQKSAKKTSVKAAATDQPGVAGSGAAAKAPVHNAVIAGVGGLAVLYGAYEYRNDVINLYRKLRGDRKTR
jgi:hypothetical protein